MSIGATYDDDNLLVGLKLHSLMSMNTSKSFIANTSTSDSEV
jgi:hypothetical protein